MILVTSIVGFLGMILLPILVWLTVMFSDGTLPSPPEAWNTIFNAVLLGQLAGIFEETARYILYKFFLKNVHMWNEGVLAGIPIIKFSPALVISQGS